MATSRWIRRAFILSCALASVGPAWQVLRLLRAGQVAKTLTEYGPLPEVAVAPVEWATLAFAAVLLVAVVLELARIRAAVLVALVATTLLWIYFGPALWAHVAGDGFFEVSVGHATAVPWQQLAYQIAAFGLAAFLARDRYRTRQE